MAESRANTALHVGVARADITPPVGIRSVGFAARGPLTRLHDPLYATALVAAGDGAKVAIVACDLLWLDTEAVAAVRDAIQARTDIPPQAVMIACSHTHYGPDPGGTSDPIVDAYRANLIHALTGVVVEANDALQPAVLGVGWGTSDIGVNRREKLPDGRVILGQNPTGAIDRAVGVLRIDAPGGAPIACVVNHQTHPVSQTGSVDHISADYPGRMRDIVEDLTGARCLFLQGACGNINAAIMEPCYEPARTLGTRLGCEVVRVWETIAPAGVAVQQTAHAWLAAHAETVDLPAQRYGSAEAAEALLHELEGDLARFAEEGAAEGRIRWTNRRLERVRAAFESWETGVLPEPVVAEVQAMRIGALGLVTAPGEIFCQIGSEVKGRSPFAETFFVSCANGSIGYVPVPEAYPDGGYEVTNASRVDPGAAAVLTEGCLTRLRALT